MYSSDKLIMCHGFLCPYKVIKWLSSVQWKVPPSECYSSHSLALTVLVKSTFIHFCGGFSNMHNYYYAKTHFCWKNTSLFMQYIVNVIVTILSMMISTLIYTTYILHKTLWRATKKWGEFQPRPHVQWLCCSLRVMTVHYIAMYIPNVTGAPTLIGLLPGS